MPKIFTSLNGFNFAELNQKLAPIFTSQSYILDLTWAVMNLLSITEHLAFTGAKTQKNSYYDLIANVQGMIAKIFAQLHVVSDNELISRNLLATSMRLLEVGTKQWSLHEEMLAQDFFQRAYELIVLFVSINQQVLPPKALSEFEPDVFQELQQYLENFDAHCQSVAPKMVTAKVMPFKDLNEFVAKVDSLKKQNRLDLSSDQDLILGIMNLINLEEEFFELGAKTKNAKYYVLLFKVREMRKHFLQIVIKNYEGEVWCISKHLLAAAMRCMQAGFKLDEALLKSELFQSAYDLYSLFWGLNLGVVGNSSLAKPQGFLGKLGSLVKKAIDCCIE